MPDRKYRQSGYQDSAGSFRTERPSGSGSGRLEGGPRGRGADRHRDEVFRCKACGEKADPEFAPDASCKKCQAALHACAQCRNFDSSAPFQCRKAVPAAIPAKSARNDCQLFEPIIVADLTGSKAGVRPERARSAFDKLFDKA